jgi:hypothetical protein
VVGPRDDALDENLVLLNKHLVGLFAGFV